MSSARCTARSLRQLDQCVQAPGKPGERWCQPSQDGEQGFFRAHAPPHGVCDSVGWLSNCRFDLLAELPQSLRPRKTDTLSKACAALLVKPPVPRSAESAGEVRATPLLGTAFSRGLGRSQACPRPRPNVQTAHDALLSFNPTDPQMTPAKSQKAAARRGRDCTRS